MSASLASQRLDGARKELERHRKTQAAEETKAAKLESEATAKARSAAATSSASLARSHSSTAASKRDQANKARERAAKASRDASTAQQKVHAAEGKLRDEEARETKKSADKRKQADTKAERDRERAEDAAQWTLRRRDAAHEQQLAELRTQLDVQADFLAAAPWDRAPEIITVLLITASPEDQQPLRIDKEMREIQKRVQASEYRDVVRFEYCMATQVTDLMQRLNESKPDVVHFSGHGAQEGLVFEDADGDTRLLDNEELAQLLSLSSKRIRLAVFNSCDSAEQAARACWHLDAAIGMDDPVDDHAAQLFAGQFYSSLAFGLPLSKAFGQAVLHVQLALGDTSGAPRLHVADGIDADQMFVVRPPGGHAATDRDA